jgi:RNA polymerase sigma-70 factor (ECF subfamily)
VTSDPDVVDALRAGDENAFRAIVTELNPGLTRLARIYVTQALAEEVVQETWAAVIRSIDGFEQRSSLKTWIYRILLNKVRTLAPREAKIVPFAAMGHTSDGHHQSVRSRPTHGRRRSGPLDDTSTRMAARPRRPTRSTRNTRRDRGCDQTTPASPAGSCHTPRRPRLDSRRSL